MDYNILIGGFAGQGMDTLSKMLELILKRKHYYVFSNKDYMSRVRGGHNFIQVRFSDKPLYSHVEELDIIVALDRNTVDIHRNRLSKKGTILIDKSISDKEIQTPDEYDFMSVITSIEVAKELGNHRVAGTVSLGAILKMLGLEIDEAVLDVLKHTFSDEIYELNVKALTRGFEMYQQKYHLDKGNFEDSIAINGNQAAALGALAGGLTFYSAYPMTPSTSFMTYLSSKMDETGIVVEQVEDEIAAINMAIGASYAGVRAMTGTSGGGFSLMTEALGLAGITETPLVVLNVQRPGPATGLPTRTEQSDLSFILTASHGEIPRMVIALKNPEHAFYTMARALNIADKYQMLVIILSDQYLADITNTIPAFDFSKIEINRHIATEQEADINDYKRYKVTENGISPRLIPGQFKEALVMADSDEHTEYAHITEAADVRIAQMDKRMRKLDMLKEELEEPSYYGSENPENLLIAWGSVEGPVREAVQRMNDQDMKIGALVFSDISPLPVKMLEKYTKQAKNIINVEMNYTGQLAKFIRQETGIVCNKSVLKYDGGQISPSEIVKRVSEVLS